MKEANKLIYDGDCGFCTASALWLERKSHKTKAIAWQQFDYASVGLTEQHVTNAAYFIKPDGSIYRGTYAMGRALLSATFPWALLGVPMVTAPFSWIACACYPIVVRYRQKLPGGTPSCSLNPPKREREE